MDWQMQDSLVPQNVELVCGLDEAGRGPLAGPVFAAAVILKKGTEIVGLNDSKKLSAKKREALYDEIIACAQDYAIAHAEVYEIDEINILNASLLAMRRAVEALRTKPQLLLIDGNVERGFTIPAVAVTGGDGKMPSIAAASILAKVERDRFCMDMDRLYPNYHFARNKGYPTAEHRALIKKYGPCPAHRRTFLSKIIGEVNAKFQEDIWH